MAVTGKQVTVGTSAVDVYDAAGIGTPQGGEAMVLNQGTASIFLGGPGVTTATGYELKTTASAIRLRLSQNEQLYAIVASATQRLDVLIFQNV